NLSLVTLPTAPRSTLLPYTPLCRSRGARRRTAGRGAVAAAGARAAPRAAAPGTPADRHQACAVEQSAAAGLRPRAAARPHAGGLDRKSTRLNSSHVQTSYAVFCLKK